MNAEQSAPPVDDVVIDEPAPVVEAEPVTEPEPEPVMTEPEPGPAPVAMSLSPEEVVMAMSSDAYAVQVTAMKDISSVQRYQAKFGLDDLTAVKTENNGSVVYVLLSLQPDRASANEASVQLEKKTGSKPWVRSVAGLQKIVMP